MVVDGRRLRREQNRDAVLDALVDLHADGVYEPSANDIAERAGLSPRSLFRYFDDVEDLNRAAIERQLTSARPLLDVGVGPDAPTAEKIERVVAARVRLYEAVAPAMRATRACAHRHDVVAAQLREGRSYFRHQLVRVFGPELAGRRELVLPALDALTSFETYELLRRDEGLSRARTIAALVHGITAVLAS